MYDMTDYEEDGRMKMTTQTLTLTKRIAPAEPAVAMLRTVTQYPTVSVERNCQHTSTNDQPELTQTRRKQRVRPLSSRIMEELKKTSGKKRRKKTSQYHRNNGSSCGSSSENHSDKCYIYQLE